MEQYKYHPTDYVDYLCESMTNFYTAFPRGTSKRLLSRKSLCGIIEVGGEAHGAVQI